MYQYKIKTCVESLNKMLCHMLLRLKTVQNDGMKYMAGLSNFLTILKCKNPCAVLLVKYTCQQYLARNVTKTLKV